MLDQKVVELKTEFGRKTGEAEALKIGLQKAVDQLAAAESLIGKLSGEKQRWSETSLSLGAMLKELPLNAILAAGFGVYLSDETEDVRSSTLKQWAEIINYHKFDIRRFLSSESEMLEWKAEGLPGDEPTFENAIVILNGVQVPLVIDPAIHQRG
ncbi:hypothetical protein PPROV_001006900 [Pycnococcus provasolii]|uniref:Dynein heavy chain coiled coil stalk domain-containing protein n=1 Tax=Pycnococcus provasolii TaxID=41880 RepID=A0A830I0U2_9CHLO|nr:hypothetical protein PPROV_001006900 [Pycnococcus provasolii]